MNRAPISPGVYRLWMLWTAVAAVFSAMVALAVIVFVESYIQPGVVQQEFAKADASQRWLMASHLAAANWKMLRSSAGFPALAVVVAGAFLSITSIRYYAISGMLALACAPMIASSGPPTDLVQPPLSPWLILTFASAGVVSGAFHWLIAGRQQTTGLFR